MTPRVKIPYPFLLTFLAAGALGIAYHLLCEPLFLIGDAPYYIQLYNGEPGSPPFGFRILTPFLARMLPYDFYTNFGIVTITSLSLVAALMVQLLVVNNYPRSFVVFFCIFFFTSFLFIYYSSALVRADGPMFLALAVMLYCFSFRTSLIPVVISLILGILAHEIILLYPLFFLIDRVFNSNTLYTGHYRLLSLVILALTGIGTFVFIHSLIRVETANSEPSYLKSSTEIARLVILNSGGIIKHLLRIYSSFGPAFIYCLFYILFNVRKNVKLSFFTSLGIITCATFLATDTLRVMALFFVFVFMFSAHYINKLWESEASRKHAVVLVLLQLAYSYTVYGHLRSIENSKVLFLVAAILSSISLLYCIFLSRKNIVGLVTSQ